MLVRKVFKKQMKVFAVEMMEEYSKSTDNDIDDALVAKIKKAMKLGLFKSKWWVSSFYKYFYEQIR